jgi:flagellin
LAIANKLNVQTSGQNRASRNSMDGVSMIQTTDGALSGVMGMLQRMRELAVQAANGVLTPEDQSKIQIEVDQYVMEITDNAGKTVFNGIRTLSGEADTVTHSIITIAPNDYEADHLVSVLSVSESVPEGRLLYTIDSPAQPAIVSVNLSSFTSGNTYAVNGVSFFVSPTDGIDNIRKKLNDACALASVDAVYDDTGMIATLATQKAGKYQKLVVAPGTPFAVTASGTDPVISYAEMFNPDGTSNDAFNNAMSVTYNGNEITFSSTNNQYIKLGVNINAWPADMYTDVTEYGPLYLQVGGNFNQHMRIQIPTSTSETLGFVEYRNGRRNILLDYTSPAGAAEAIGMVDKAVAHVSDVRAKLGAYQNRLEQTVENLDTAAINTEEARSRIQDTDMAMAMTLYTQYNVKYQAGMAILAQANQRPQQILSLLQ